MVEKNGSIRRDDCYNQSLGVNSDMQQRSKNYPRLINFMQGKNQENNNVEDVKTQSMVAYASSSTNNINASLTTRYGQVLPLALSNAPPQKNGYHLLSHPSQIDSMKNFMQDEMLNAENYQQQNNVVDVKTQSMAPYGSSSSYSSKNTTNASLMAATGYGYCNVDLLNLPSHSNKNFTFNDVGLQGHQISGLPSHPYGAGSLYPNHQRNNNPFMFNCLNPLPRVDTTNFHGMKDILKPGFVPPIQVQDLDIVSPKDLSRERALKRPLCALQDFDIMASASKRPRMGFTSPNHYEGKQSGLNELLHFKDPSSTFKIKTHAKENTDKKKLDLSLHI
ncbi:unnamed protein product [Sphenostylis stenocarpa]|uniref:Uncharacterized protein n=1 Tax=Sphenostylis stenocarpa TaxID=92480 RepID=A0AA86SYR5_9FABA|nr:unnamed protein product [Sphenostylis stenocarpa]